MGWRTKWSFLLFGMDMKGAGIMRGGRIRRSRQVGDAPSPVNVANTTGRVAYIDGLRGAAVGMVLIFHAWTHRPVPVTVEDNAVRRLLELAMSKMSIGVSLFLVLSGFCLALPLLQRRARGQERWFTPSEFFAKRCLRILPPYYLALALCVAASLLLPQRFLREELTVIGAPPDAANLLSHVLLVHNLTPYNFAINGSFWSLGLEWQWYWLFPLLLVLCIRAPMASLAFTAVAAAVWQKGTHELWGESALPLRLFEFCCGIIAARLVVDHRRLPSWALASGLLLSAATAAAVQFPNLAGPWLGRTVTDFGLRHPLTGLMFAFLVLLGNYSQALNAVLSWRPLVGLGIASYSIYLVHEPIGQAIAILVARRLGESSLVMLLAIGGGVACGVVFHFLVERPLLDRARWARLLPLLARCFTWTDRPMLRLEARNRNVVRGAKLEPSPHQGWNEPALPDRLENQPIPAGKQAAANSIGGR